MALFTACADAKSETIKCGHCQGFVSRRWRWWMFCPDFKLISVTLIGDQLTYETCILLCFYVCFYSPDPLTGHISGICPRAQQRPVSQQHCILVNWPLSSAAQRPLARAEKQVPTRWSEGRGNTFTELDNWAGGKILYVFFYQNRIQIKIMCFLCYLY